jgi:hypothetical protein
VRLRISVAVAVLAVLAVGLALLPDDPDGARPADRGSLTGRAGDQPPQTSDRLPGEIAEPLPPGVAPRVRITSSTRRRVAPGVSYREWEQTDRRGPVHGHLVTVAVDRPDIELDYASLGKVARRGPLTELLGRDAAVAGVNGGFFDIYDTGAPLGVGRDRDRGFLHASKYTWTNAFSIDQDGTARIRPIQLQATIAEHPEIEITNVNSPRVREGKVGVYTSAWGRTSGYSATDGQRRNVRVVEVEDGRVVARSTQLSRGERIRGSLLIGRGPGAEQLADLRVGSRVTVTAGVPERYAFAISGESILLRRGRVAVTDDVYLHPRTAVGIDHDTGKVLLLVVDGRQDDSRGLTLVELARMMRSLGAEAALNLDGGGSSTLAGLNRRDRLRVLNSPSDGSQRAIPDGIAVLASQ